MSLAEKKQLLLHIVEDADDKLTGLLIALANEYNQPEYKITDADVRKFEERRDAFFDSGEEGYTAEDSIARLYKKIK